MDGNTGNVYPKHKQRNNSDNKIQTNSKKSKKSKNQSISLRKTLATPNRLQKNEEDEEIKRKRNLKKTKSINQSINQ